MLSELSTFVKPAYVFNGNDNPVIAKHCSAKYRSVTVSDIEGNVTPFNVFNLSDAVMFTIAGTPISRLKKSGIINPVHINTSSI